MDRALFILQERASREVICTGDATMSSGAAIRLIFARVPKLFDASLVKEDRHELENISSEIVRLLAIANANLNPGNRFSHSPEYKEALEAYTARVSGPQTAEQEILLHAR